MPKTEYPWEAGRYKPFKCPICGSDSYVEVRVRKPNGDWYTTEFFECSGCSVMFTDPEDFTRKRQHIRDTKPLTD